MLQQNRHQCASVTIYLTQFTTSWDTFSHSYFTSREVFAICYNICPEISNALTENKNLCCGEGRAQFLWCEAFPPWYFSYVLFKWRLISMKTHLASSRKKVLNLLSFFPSHLNVVFCIWIIYLWILFLCVYLSFFHSC